ncbi:MAG: restriction endonuclease subunit S [Clostridiales bacterium]|nr:restriction endonuclease subunit S [Clostridiales bacterium]
MDNKRIPITGGNRKAGEYPYYGASGIVDYVADYIFDDDLLLISEDGANLVARVTPIAFPSTGKVWINNHAHVIKFKSMAMQCYVESLLNMMDISPYVTGTAQPKLNQAKLNSIPIPVPEESQIREYLEFVKQSDKSKFVRFKSQFIEMFGDPVTNTNDREIRPFSDFMTNIRYGTSQPPAFSEDGQYKFIRATNIKGGRITETDMLRINQEAADKIQKCKLDGNEIIIVRSGANTGDTCVVTEGYRDQYAGYDIIVSLDLSKANPVFFNELMNTHYMQSVIKPLTVRSAQPHLNTKQVQNLPMLIATLDEQNLFADFVQQSDKSK